MKSSDNFLLFLTDSDVIMVSPVHPVTEGQSVTLGCNLMTGSVVPALSFYKNDKLIQNDSRRELFILAVSKSDEGFYKCGGKHSLHDRLSWTSPESWMSVKCEDHIQNCGTQ